MRGPFIRFSCFVRIENELTEEFLLTTRIVKVFVHDSPLTILDKWNRLFSPEVSVFLFFHELLYPKISFIHGK